MHKWRNRNQNDLFEPHITPKFKIKRDAKFFMFGSCFARYLEWELHNNGHKVLSIPRAKMPLDTNRYHLPSILQAIERSVPNTKESFVRDKHGVWGDPYLQTPRKAGLSLDDLMALRNEVDEISSRVFKADVVILTLGLTETWYDNNTLQYAFRNFKDDERFEFANLDHHECYNELSDIADELRCAKIIITVSPIPLNATFTDQDVVVANAYSKATLRNVAQEVAGSRDDVDYFPSYEMVLHSKAPWKGDGRHVKKEVVEHVMRQFIAHYIEEG